MLFDPLSPWRRFQRRRRLDAPVRRSTMPEAGFDEGAALS
jgi:hypothetical protein